MAYPTKSILVAAALGGAAALALPVLGQEQEAHGDVLLTPDDIQYQPGPDALEEGAESAVLYGDPAAEGPFALRLKLPDGFAIAPHIHSGAEIVTVISGTFLLGEGEEADREAATELEAGSFFAFEPGGAHYAFAEGETVVQINTTGPWGIEYVNPEDDPRK